MGVMTSFFLADPTLISTFNRDFVPLAFQPRIDVTGITTLELSTLLAIVSGQAYEIRIMDQFIPIIEEETGCWLYQIPNTFVTALAQTSETAVQDFAEAWLATDELVDADPPAIEALLIRLHQLGIQATNEQKVLLLLFQL